jgi:hypothetical protein
MACKSVSALTKERTARSPVIMATRDDRRAFREVEAPMTLRVGDRAPDFVLPGTNGSRLALVSLRGRPVVLVFLRWLG